MALGGIAVSGGATGHGTLLYCNLLYSPLMLDAYGIPLARPSYEIGGTAGATGFEASFAIDRDQRTLFKTAAAGTDLTYTMVTGADPAAVVPTVYGVVLLGHNLTAANIDDAADSFAGAWLEGGNDTDYDAVSEAIVVNAAALTPAYCILTTPADYDHWRIRVNFNSSLALQLGEVFLIGGAPLAFTKNYNKRFPSALDLGVTKDSGGISGVPRAYTRWVSRYMEIHFTNISDAQLLAMQDAAQNRHVVFSPTGASGPAYFGVWKLEQPVYVTADKWDVVAHFTESRK
jgi:hypothetical protein